MAPSFSRPIPIRPVGSGPVCLKIDLPGVPWYMYNDHFDGYVPFYRPGGYGDMNDAANNNSCLVFDIAATNPGPNKNNTGGELGGILLGGAELPLRHSGNLVSTKIESEVRGWHIQPGDNPLATFQRQFNEPGRTPSDIYRTVLVDAEYTLQSTRGNYEFEVTVKSIVGAGMRDQDTSRGRDRVEPGTGEFKLVLSPSSTGEKKGGGGWSIVRVEGAEIRDFMKPEVEEEKTEFEEVS